MITDEQIDQLKAENPGVEFHELRNEEVELAVIVRTPSDGDWRRFRSQASDDAQRGAALRGLVMSCVKHPAAAEFQAAVMARPGIIETIGNKLVEIAGVSMATTVRKL